VKIKLLLIFLLGINTAAKIPESVFFILWRGNDAKESLWNMHSVEQKGTVGQMSLNTQTPLDLTGYFYRSSWRIIVQGSIQDLQVRFGNSQGILTPYYALDSMGSSASGATIYNTELFMWPLVYASQLQPQFLKVGAIDFVEIRWIVASAEQEVSIERVSLEKHHYLLVPDPVGDSLWKEFF
jgi:hypothetical protein